MHVLIVDDEQANLEYFARALKQYRTEAFLDPVEAIEYCRTNSPEVIVADQKMPAYTGIELIKEISKINNDFIGIIVSAYTDVEDLIEAVNSNVIYKYIVKPFSPDVLLQHVLRAIEYLTLKRENAELTEKLQAANEKLSLENKALRHLTEDPLDAFIGFHPSVLKIKELVNVYARSDFPVLISGETGTGKELIAKAIHNLSPRKDNKFLPINCSAFNEQLLESELFGHEKGAFTGADRTRQGLLHSADGGSLFLDEIGDFPYNLQAKILRFIQFGTYIPVGSTKEKKVDVRIISATNKNLQEEIHKKLFRRDLFFRINSLHIHIPPLRERAEDVLYIFESIAVRRGIPLPTLTDEAKRLLEQCAFSGNVRELENLLEKLSLHIRAYGNDRITQELVREYIGGDHQEENLGKDGFWFEESGDREHLGTTEGRGMNTRDRVLFATSEFEPPRVKDSNNNTADNGAKNGSEFSLPDYLASLEKQIIEHYFEKNGYNITRTAKELAVSRQGLKNKFRRLGIPFGDGK